MAELTLPTVPEQEEHPVVKEKKHKKEKRNASLSTHASARRSPREEDGQKAE